jgi:hypothetical protein
MRKINLSNSKKRDAILGFEAKPTQKKVFQVLKDGTERVNVKVLESTFDTSIEGLTKKFPNIEDISDAIIKTDIDCDFEKAGLILDHTTKIYVDKNQDVVYNVKIAEVVKAPDGTIQKQGPLEKKDANIAVDSSPLKWTGKSIPKEVAAKKFIFSKHYQIKHVNGLTYDFLYEMASELDKTNSLMFIGAGKGNEPLQITSGNTSYRGFLEGRIDGDKYMLILHLTNLELKEFTK